jgi:hypothetical protein
MIPQPALEYGHIPSPSDVRALSGELATAAREIHSAWEQDIDGYDEELGHGGICHDIADAMLGVLARNGVEHALSFHTTMGENHVYVVALLSDGVYAIDIPPDVYEIGSGYVWRKRHDAVISAGDVVIGKVGDFVDPEEFEHAYVE